MAVTIFPEFCFIAMENNACPIHVDVGMLKFIPCEKHILDVKNYFFFVGSKDLKNTVQSSFAKFVEAKFCQNFRPGDPFVRPLYTEVIR